MRRCLIFLIIGGLLTGVLSVACNGGGEEKAGQTPTAVSTPTGPSFSFEGPVGIDVNTYAVFFDQGRPVRITIFVAVKEPTTLYYRTTQRYDIVVTDSGGNEVWRWSKDKTFGEVLEQVNLGANEWLTFDESWDQLDSSGQPVPPGTYRVTATSTHCDASYENCGQLSASTTLQIRAP